MARRNTLEAELIETVNSDPEFIYENAWREALGLPVQTFTIIDARRVIR